MNALPTSEPANSDRPNVLLICTDQQRFDALAAAGNQEISTPNLDRLAARGAMFENCYVQSTVCAPSRASLMTGQYVHNHGLYANGVGMPENARLLPEAVEQAGYDCGLVGKWHLDACFGPRTEAQPKGMRVWRWSHAPYWGSSENAYHRWLSAAHPDLFEQLEQRRIGGIRTAGVASDTFDTLPTEAHYSRWVGNETISFLTSDRLTDRPFFFIANFFDPHHSFGAPKEYVDRYRASELSRPNTTIDELASKPPVMTEASHESYAGHAPGYTSYSAAELQDVKANYYAMVSLVDDEVGRILAALESEGLIDNTVVIFTSDHGEMLGDHQLMLKGPFLYDCAIKVPLIISWPGHVPEGQRVHDLVQWIDLTATVTELTGADLPRCQGSSLLALFDGSEAPVEHRGWALSEYRDSGHPLDPPVHVTMVRKDNFKIMVHHGPPSTNRQRTGELYDLSTDPEELTNLWGSADHNQIRAEMTALLLDALVATEDRSQQRKAFW